MNKIVKLSFFIISVCIITTTSAFSQKYIAIENIEIESSLFKKAGIIYQGDTIQEVISIDGKIMKVKQNGKVGFIDAKKVKKVNEQSLIDSIPNNTENKEAKTSIKTLTSRKIGINDDLTELKRAIRKNRLATNSIYGLTTISIATSAIGAITYDENNKKTSLGLFIASGLSGIGSLIASIVMMESQHRINSLNYKIQCSANGIAITF